MTAEPTRLAHTSSPTPLAVALSIRDRLAQGVGEECRVFCYVPETPPYPHIAVGFNADEALFNRMVGVLEIHIASRYKGPKEIHTLAQGVQTTLDHMLLERPQTLSLKPLDAHLSRDLTDLQASNGLQRLRLRYQLFFRKESRRHAHRN